MSSTLPSPSSKNRTSVRSQTGIRLTRAALQTAFLLSEDFGASMVERLFTSPRRYPRPERERAVLSQGRRFTVDVALRSPAAHAHWQSGHREITAWRWGFGPAVLLVHGWEGRGSQLGAFVEPLVRAGLSVIAFDAPGHGDSPGHRLYLTDHADSVLAVAAAVGPLHAIVAHSFGAAAVLLAHHRGTLGAKRTVMIAPNALIDDVLAGFARSLGLDDRDRAAFEHQLARQSGVAIASLAPEQLVGARDGALLIIHDRADREVAFAQGERLAALWPSAVLHATEGLGHRRILRDPGVVAAAVELITQGVPAPASELVREVDRLLGATEL